MDKPIERLNRFIGTWTCEETYHAGGWTPTEVKSTSATDEIRWGPGGNSIIADYVSESGIGHYEAHDVIVWDAAQNTFRFIFFDSFGSFQDQTGDIEGNVATFASREQFNEQEGTLRRVYTFTKETQNLVVDFTDDAGNITKLVTIQKRLKG